MLMPVQFTTLNFINILVIYKNIDTVLTIMTIWQDHYNQAISNIANIKRKNIGVILGFNINIDKVTKITPENIGKKISKIKIPLPTIYEPPKHPVVNSKEEFISALLYSMVNGRADERIITANLCKWIEKSLAPFTTQIGGQAGIMANQLAKLGIENIFLNIPYKNETLLSLLNSKIRKHYINGKEEKQKIKKIKTGEIPPITHYIIEYQKGNYKIRDLTIKCPRDNRFIASYDVINADVTIDKEFTLYSINNAKNYELAIISGFQLLDTRSSKNKGNIVLKNTVELIRSWKFHNPKLYVHLEFAAINDLEFLEKLVRTLLPLVDSIGVNETELYRILKALKYPHLIVNNNSVNYFEGALWLWKLFPNLRIHFHHLGYYFVITKKTNEKQLKRIRSALIGAALGAVVKATNNIIDSLSDLLHLKNYEVSEIGIKELKRIEDEVKKYKLKSEFAKKWYSKTDEFAVVAIPTIVVENPKYLVGLGDTISLLALVLERLLP